MLTSLIFYLFAGVLLMSASMVVIARNPVHAVLFLILCFFNASGLFVLLGAEFIAMIMAIVYVGAVAVLFLFVVMMLDISMASLKRDLKTYMPIGLLVGGVFLAQCITIFGLRGTDATVVLTLASDETNTKMLGGELYTNYFLAFQMSGLVLLIAMIGAIVLTLRQRPGVKKQSIDLQNRVSPGDAMEIKKVASRTGIS